MTKLSGADGITIHPRPDQRHARYDDIAPLKKLCDIHNVELNIEGYPTPDFLHHCIENQVHQVTLVPDAPDQITSDHGWIVSKHTKELTPIIARLKQAGIRSSLFMDCDAEEIQCACQVGADRIELHTESYARSFESNTHKQEIEKFANAHNIAIKLGMGVNAGHDLNLENLAFFLTYAPVSEVSIGHALTVEALLQGWKKTITDYKAICNV